MHGDGDIRVNGYNNSDFQLDVDDRKLIFVFIFILNRGVVSSKSSKQSITAYSITEDEYMATCDAVKEGVWIRKFVIEFQVVPDMDRPLPLYCDKNGVIV